MAPERWVACPNCGLLHRLGEIPQEAGAVGRPLPEQVAGWHGS